MPDHPSTFRGDPTNVGEIHWNDRATLQLSDHSDGSNALQRGTFAELIRHIMMLPEEDRDKYLIAKAGDREYSAAEAAELFASDDFPDEEENE